MPIITARRIVLLVASVIGGKPGGMAKSGKAPVAPEISHAWGSFMKNGMLSGWCVATAVVLTTAGAAVAQAPVNRAVDNSDYSRQGTAATRSVVSMPETPATVMPASLTFDAAPPATVPAHPAAFSPGNVFGDLPDNGPPPYRVWGSADGLFWKIKSPPLPPLVATVPFGGILKYDTQFLPGVNTHNFTPITIQPTANVAANNPLSQNEQFGGRFTAGVWLDPEQNFGIDGGGFFLATHHTGFASTSGSANQGGIPLTGINHFFIMGTTIPTETFPAFLIRQVNENLTGTASAGLWGTELNARCASASLGAVSGFAGFRYINFHEDLGVQNSFQMLIPPGTKNDGGANSFGSNLGNLQYNTTDSIHTRNEFYGGQVGLDMDMFVYRFIIDLRAAAALGVMHQTADVFGANTLNGTTAAGGLLSAPQDLGTHTRN
ncbi:MAG TPA: BBP7 family outer membrane beta-barrel protein, partial [Gemmataceae bacterium]|nr:BBP7 family outer membrane beta-barrel protein [Gemmataceae bacterium]